MLSRMQHDVDTAVRRIKTGGYPQEDIELIRRYLALADKCWQRFQEGQSIGPLTIDLQPLHLGDFSNRWLLDLEMTVARATRILRMAREDTIREAFHVLG